MNDLISAGPSIVSAEVVVSNDRFCRRCGAHAAKADNFCGSCGANCSATIEIIDPATNTSVAHIPISSPETQIAPVASRGSRSKSAISMTTNIPAVEAVLNNRLAVIGMIAFLGPMGFPALWFSPRFKKSTKVISTIVYVLVTTVIPIALAWYWLEYSMRPLVEALGN